MERLQVLLKKDESLSGIFKDRDAVHRDGDLHRSAHVWVVRRDKKGKLSVLLQRRSLNKDAFPGCLDTSCAGHVVESETYESTALRELEEELGIVPPNLPIFLFDFRVRWEREFHGRRFINNEINRVFMLETDDVDLNRFQKEEISGLVWQDAGEVLQALQNGDARYCINLPLFEEFIEHAGLKRRRYNIHIGDYSSHPDAGSYAGSDEWVYHEIYPFYGSRSAAIAKAKAYVKEFYEDTSPYVASVRYWLTDPYDDDTDITNEEE